MATYALPKFDSTLGALFIGLNVASIMYGINCVQIFIYATSRRGKRDKPWIKLFMYTLFFLDTGHQVCNVIALYRWLIQDFLNPIALLAEGPGGGRFMLALEACFGVAMITAVQLYFAWRVWAFSLTSKAWWRWIASVVTVCLAIITCCTNSLIVVNSFSNSNSGDAAFFWNSELALRDWKIALPAAIVCDVIITAAMVINLARARTGIERTDNGLMMLITFTVNTCLITTVITIASLVTFIVLPSSLVFAALEFVVPKSYVNSAMAFVNSREYLRDKMRGDGRLSSVNKDNRTSVPVNVTSYWEDRRLSRMSYTSLPPPTYNPYNVPSGFPNSSETHFSPQSPPGSVAPYSPYSAESSLTLRYSPRGSSYYLATLPEQEEDRRYHVVAEAI